MKKYVIEREMPGVGKKSELDLCHASAHSNEALAAVGPGIQWLESFVTHDKVFCVYLADNEQKIQEHAQRSGFPANAIREVRTMLDPSRAVAG